MVENEINIENLFLILRRHAWLVLGIVTVAVVIAGIITYQTPKLYMATTLLNFDFSATNPMDERGGGLSVKDSYIKTQVGILGSLNVAQQVVDSLTEYERERLIETMSSRRSPIQKFIYRSKRTIKTLFSSADSRVPTRAASEEDSFAVSAAASSSEILRVRSPYESLVRAIGSGLTITPVFNSHIVEVSYMSTHPKMAALMADRFSEAYIATNLGMVIDPANKSKKWFNEQLKSLRVELEEAQARLTVYQQEEGIVSSDQRVDIETSRLSTLSSELVVAQGATRNAETDKQKLKEVLDSGESLMTFELVFNNQVVRKIKAEIRDLESKYVQSSDTLGANHPKIKSLKSELSAARMRLNSEIETITDGINNAADLSKKREQNLEQALEKQKNLVLGLKKEHDTIAVLQRGVESAQTTYNAALSQLNTTSMQSMVDQTNVSIVDYASIPSYHAEPRVMKNLAIAAFGGLLLGVGLVVFMGVFIRRVHSKEDIFNELRVPVLGHLKKV